MSFLSLSVNECNGQPEKKNSAIEMKGVGLSFWYIFSQPNLVVLE